MHKVLWSKKSDHWSTPEDFLTSLGKIDLDPCPLNGSGGLEIPWNGRVFVNPPYSGIRSWLEKGVKEMEQGGGFGDYLPSPSPDRYQVVSRGCFAVRHRGAVLERPVEIRRKQEFRAIPKHGRDFSRG